MTPGVRTESFSNPHEPRSRRVQVEGIEEECFTALRETRDTLNFRVQGLNGQSFTYVYVPSSGEVRMIHSSRVKDLD